jgi:negative regulator of sigma E activity
MNMTQHDQISAYIDGELSPEQEQDFLISLASSDGLRKSFRSELVMKNVIHRDEVLTSPSRKMRGAVLTTLGITGTAALASESAEAATTVLPAAKATFIKTLFASKMGALVTASVVTASALGGYGLHSIVSERTAPTVITAPIQKSQPAMQVAPQETTTPVTATENHQSHASAPKRTSTQKNTVKVKEPIKAEQTTTSGMSKAKSLPPVKD